MNKIKLKSFSLECDGFSLEYQAAQDNGGFETLRLDRQCSDHIILASEEIAVVKSALRHIDFDKV